MIGADTFLKEMQRNVFHAHHDKLRTPNVTEILLEYVRRLRCGVAERGMARERTQFD